VLTAAAPIVVTSYLTRSGCTYEHVPGHIRAIAPSGDDLVGWRRCSAVELVTASVRRPERDGLVLAVTFGGGRRMLTSPVVAVRRRTVDHVVATGRLAS
jgi:hypothetical protein